MYALLLKQFLRSRMTLMSLLLLMIIGISAIIVGRQFLQKQDDTIAKVTAHQRMHIERNVAANKEMGLLMYYLKFALISKPDKLAAISIGQRDINPGIQSVTIRTLEAQKYDTDLINPVQLHSGNLDLGFVIIYLFPLIIIAFTFNLFLEDVETGTWRLVAVQSRSPFRFLLAKLAVRAFFIYAMLIALLVIAVVLLSIPFTEAFVAMFVLAALYIAFWFALSFWLMMFKRSSAFNIVTLLSAWVILIVLLPASINNLVASVYPVPEALRTMIKQRDGYHKKWDLDKKVAMDKFYAHYPQFKYYGVTDDNFWIWYYAMQQLGDDESSSESADLRQKLRARESMSRAIAFAIPTLHTQMHLNDIAQTSLVDYLRLLDAVSAFHEKKRLYFYPKIFENADTKAEDWKKFTPELLAARQGIDWLSMIMPLTLMTIVLSGWGAMRLQQLSVEE